MFHLYMTLFVALLFAALTPGVLLTLPSAKSSTMTVALVHGLVFAVVFHLTHKAVWNAMYGGAREGFYACAKPCKRGTHCQGDTCVPN